jgi:hypothetical protein
MMQHGSKSVHSSAWRSGGNGRFRTSALVELHEDGVDHCSAALVRTRRSQLRRNVDPLSVADTVERFPESSPAAIRGNDDPLAHSRIAVACTNCDGGAAAMARAAANTHPADTGTEWTRAGQRHQDLFRKSLTLPRRECSIACWRASISTKHQAEEQRCPPPFADRYGGSATGHALASSRRHKFFARTLWADRD